MTAKKRLYALILGICLGLLCLLFFFLLMDLSVITGLFRMTDRICDPPRAFGIFHLIFLSVCVLLSSFAGILGAKKGQSATDGVLFWAGLLLLFLEVYKQFYSYFILNDREYDFGFFPFQFCSLPLYLFLLLPFLPHCRIKELLTEFAALYGTMGGCLVMAYPAFYDRVSLCVHTMVWHTVMISVGVFLLFAKGYGKSWRREVLGASLPFLISVGVATLLNVCLYRFSSASPNPLNLYYLSPYYPTRFLVVREVRELFGWLPSVLCYILLFIFVGATLVFYITKMIRLIGNVIFLKKTKKK